MTSPGIAQGTAPQPANVALSNVNYIPPGFESLYKEPFSYNVIFNNLSSGATQTASTQINNDSFFVCTQQMGDIWDANTGNTTNTPIVSAPMRVRALDTSTGKYFMDQAVPISSYFGTAEQPKVWLYRARIFMPGGQIQVELSNRMATAQQIILTFEGFKVYNVPDSLRAS
jgi:hypothetical protein